MGESENIFILCKATLKLKNNNIFFMEFDLPPYLIFDWDKWEEDERLDSNRKSGRRIEILIPISLSLKGLINARNLDLAIQIKKVVEEVLLNNNRIKSLGSLEIPELEMLYSTTVTKRESEKSALIIGPLPDDFSGLLAEALRLTIDEPKELIGTTKDLTMAVSSVANKIPPEIFPIAITEIEKAQGSLSL